MTRRHADRRPPAPGVQECRLYRFWDADGVLLYVGETARQPFVRMMEHVAGQPWSDLVGRYEVDARVFDGKAAVLAAERQTIRAERPLHNVEHNQANPRRVPTPVARRERGARNAARGQVTVVVPRQTRPRPTRRRVQAARRRSWWRWAWRHRRPLAAVVVWLVVAGWAWTVLDDTPAGDRWWMAAGAASVALAVVRAGRKKRRRRRRR